MSRRPISEKRAARMRKAIARKSLPAFIDPVRWLMVRGHAKTAGAARDLILAGRLKSESHTVGVITVPRRQVDGEVRDQKVVARVPVAQRDTLRVEPAA